MKELTEEGKKAPVDGGPSLIRPPCWSWRIICWIASIRSAAGCSCQDVRIPLSPGDDYVTMTITRMEWRSILVSLPFLKAGLKIRQRAHR